MELLLNINNKETEKGIMEPFMSNMDQNGIVLLGNTLEHKKAALPITKKNKSLHIMPIEKCTLRA